MSTREDIKKVIVILQAAFPAKKIDNLTALVDAYLLGLSDIDMQHLEGALESLIREKTFFPAVAEIREYAQRNKNATRKISPLAMREEAIKLKDRYIAGQDNLDQWLGLASRMRINGQECAAAALEQEALGQHDNSGLITLVNMQKAKEVAHAA